jgi:hypothetical protein
MLLKSYETFLFADRNRVVMFCFFVVFQLKNNGLLLWGELESCNRKRKPSIGEINGLESIFDLWNSCQKTEISSSCLFASSLSVVCGYKCMYECIGFN